MFLYFIDLCCFENKLEVYDRTFKLDTEKNRSRTHILTQPILELLIFLDFSWPGICAGDPAAPIYVVIKLKVKGCKVYSTSAALW